ncbi:hypothetical protein QF027_000347 [Streptomyces canus]|nr:hypothetical protein [Streptomyces canus]
MCITCCTRRPIPPPITSPAAAPTRPSVRNRNWLLSRGPWEGGGIRLPAGGPQLRLLHQRRLVPRTARGGPGLRGGAQAAQLTLHGRPVTRTSGTAPGQSLGGFDGATGTPRPGEPPMPVRTDTAPTHLAGRSWPPPTRPGCRRRPRGTWPQPAPPRRTPRHGQCARLPTSPRLSASTVCGRGSSRAMSRSRTNSTGPTSRSAPHAPSAATRPRSTVPSPSAETSGSPYPDRRMPPRRTRAPNKGPERGPPLLNQSQRPCWPRALRVIRSWLAPAITLTRCWQAWTHTDPPHELQALIDAVTTGHGIDLYLRI